MKRLPISLLAAALSVAGLHAQIPESLIPELSTSTTTSVNYDMDDISSFTLSSMDADWRNPGNGFSGQISYDVVAEHFMGLNIAYQFAPWIKVKAGVMKMQYIHELAYSPRTLECSGYSLGTSYLGGYTKDLCGLNSRARDVGVMLSGSLLKRNDRYLLSYTAGVFNGNAYSFKDDNHSKNFAASLLYSPTKHLNISAGTMIGKYSVDDNTLGDRNRYTIGVWYDDGQYFLKGENIYGKTGEMKSNGTSLMLGTWFNPNMAIAVRGDHFYKDLDDTKNSRINKVDVCFSHKLGKVFRYRFQYSHTFNADPAKDDVNMLTLSISMKFSTKDLK